MSGPSDPLSRARAVKARYEDDLMQRPGVVAVGVGLRKRGGEITGEIAIIVSVRAKRPPDHLDEAERLPDVLDGVPVDVQEVGDVAAL